MRPFLLRAWEYRDRGNITFNVQGETIKAHNLILSAGWEHFSGILSAGVPERPIVINDVRPRIFRAMISYVYLQRFEDTEGELSLEDLMDLYIAGLQYSLRAERPLHQMIQERLQSNNLDALILVFDRAVASGIGWLERLALNHITKIPPEAFREINGRDELFWQKVAAHMRRRYF
jgi:hypothetical protein